MCWVYNIYGICYSYYSFLDRLAHLFILCWPDTDNSPNMSIFFFQIFGGFETEFAGEVGD